MITIPQRHNVTDKQTDRQTDGRTDRQLALAISRSAYHHAVIKRRHYGLYWYLFIINESVCFPRTAIVIVCM